MARKLIHVLIDDIDGAELEAGETVRFGVDGREFEIDLSAEHAAELRAALAPYVAAGRRVQRQRGRRAAAATVRAWAAENGIEVSSHGRIPAEVMSRFQAEAQL